MVQHFIFMYYSFLVSLFLENLYMGYSWWVWLLLGDKEILWGWIGVAM